MDTLSLVESHLVTALGEVRARASVTFVGCDPIEVLKFDAPSGATYATVGMSRRPMVDPTDLAPDPVRGPRAEVLVTLDPDEDRVLRTLAVVAMSPTVDGIVVSEGVTIDLSEPLWPGAEYTGFVVNEPELVGLALPAPADAVRFFPLTPLSAQELAIAREVRTP